MTKKEYLKREEVGRLRKGEFRYVNKGNHHF